MSPAQKVLILVLKNANTSKVLHHKKTKNGIWELPGGDIQPEESVFEASSRLFAEQHGCEIPLEALGAVEIARVGQTSYLLWFSRNARIQEETNGIYRSAYFEEDQSFDLLRDRWVKPSVGEYPAISWPSVVGVCLIGESPHTLYNSGYNSPKKSIVDRVRPFVTRLAHKGKVYDLPQYPPENTPVSAA